MNSFSQFEQLQAEIAGIPYLWFHEIDHACDRFLAKRGIRTFGWREQMNLDVVVARRARRDCARSHTPALAPAPARNRQ